MTNGPHTFLTIEQLKKEETYLFRLLGTNQTDDSIVCYTSEKVGIIGMQGAKILVDL